MVLTVKDGSELISGVRCAEFLCNVYRRLTVHVLDGDVSAVLAEQLGYLETAV